MISRKFVFNCFLLVIPILLWNIILVNYLPPSYSSDIFWKDIPLIVAITENILRVIVLALPALMILSLKTRVQKVGFAVYIIGILLYFMSWAIVIIYPQSGWSLSLLGFMAPAYSTLLWFVGIGLIGSKVYFKIPFLSKNYILISLLFVFFHTLHTYIVFTRLNIN